MCAITGNVETYNPATHRVEQRAAKEFAGDLVKVESRQLDDVLSNLARTNAEVSVLGSMPEHAKPAWLKVFERDPEYKEKLQAASYMTGLLPQLREAEKEGDLIRAAQLLGSYDAVSRWAENALSGDEADYMERLRRRLDKAGVEIIPSAVNKPFTGDTPELRAASAFHDDALFPGETIVAACTAAGVRRRVIGMDPVVTPAEVTVASHTVRNPELKYDGRTFTPTRVTVDREHGTVRIFTYDEPISGDSRQLGRELFPDLPDRKVYETEISLRAYDRMLQRAGWKYTANEEGRRIWMRPEAEKEVADAIEKESRNPENKPQQPQPEETPGTPEAHQSAEPETPEREVEDSDNGRILSETQAVALLSDMKANAVTVPHIEVTEENWRPRVDTPIGSVKMGENQKTKLLEKGRADQYGMMLTTLSQPDIILEEQDREEDSNHERPFSYLFIKTFQKEDGSKFVHFESVTVAQEGMEVSISSHIIRENQLKEKLKSDRLRYKATALDVPARTSAEQPANEGGSLSSRDKVNTNPGQIQTNSPEIPEKPVQVELKDNDSVFIGGQETPILFVNPDGSIEVLSVLPINENSVEDGTGYSTTFPSREALEEVADRRPDGSLRVIRDGKELEPQDQTSEQKQPESGNPARPADAPKQPGSNAPAEGNGNPPGEGNVAGNPPSRPEGNGGNPPREPKQGGNPPSRPEGENPPGEPKGGGEPPKSDPPTEPKGGTPPEGEGGGNPPREPKGGGNPPEGEGGEPPKSDPPAGGGNPPAQPEGNGGGNPPEQPAEPADPKGLRDGADRAQRDIDALEKQIESHRAKEPSRLSAGTSYEEKHAKWQQRMDELQDQLPPLRELVLKWRAKADRLEQEQTEAEERGVIAEGGIPEDADGNWQFHKVTPEHTYRFLTERQGYTADDVIATADANIDAKEPKKPKLGANAKANAEKLQDYNRRLEEFNRNREYWQQVKEIAVRDKAEAEKAAEAARAEEIRRQEEERRRAEEEAARRGAEKGVGPEITGRWNGAEKIQGRDDAIITPSGRTIRGRYILVEEGSATPSHDPETGFAKSPGFPVDNNGNTVNDRDYERDKAAQQYVHRVAAGYDGRAVQDPVIVSRDGVVLSGNNRTMSGRIAARDNTDAGYIGHLEATAAKYGFTAEQVRSMKHPRLYFEAEETLPYTAETFALFNKTEKKEMNVTERSVKLGKTISEGVFNRMAREMDAYETFAEYARSPGGVQAIKDLHAAGIIETAELPRFYSEETGNITPEGVSLLQGALIGHVFSENPDVVRMAMQHPVVRDSILKALVALAENSRFSPEYSLIGDISRAIEIYHKGKEAGFRTVSESVLQHSLLEEPDIPETTALVIADLLNGGKTTRLQKFLKEYNADARLADAGQLDIFSENAEPKPAEEILRQVYETLGINPRQYERYEKLRNNGKPDEPTDPDDNGPEGNGGGNAPEPNGPQGGKPGGGGEPPQTPARPAGGTPQPGGGTEPSDAQKRAGNYRKEHRSIDGYRISIENPKGSVRRGADKNGKPWENTMRNDYGYIRGTTGADGDHIDVFLSDSPERGDVFVIDQVKEDGSFDEHKVMYGFSSEQEARQAYLSNYAPGWNGLGDITRVSKGEFKKWINSSRRKGKPFAEYKNVKTLTEEVDQTRTNVDSEGLIVDNEGKPMVFYHGTPNDVEKLEDLEPGHTRRGEDESARFNGDGVSFTPHRDVAEDYANDGHDKGKVFRARIRLKNPYFTVGVANFTPEEAAAFTAELKAKGYDGIINYASLAMRETGAEPNEVIVFDISSAIGTDTAADLRITLRQREGETGYQVPMSDVLEAAGRPRGMFDVAKTASHWHFGGLYDSDGRGSFLFPDSERAEVFLKAAEQYPGDPQAFEKAARELAGRRDDGLFHKGEKYTVGEDNTTLEILSPRSLRGDYEVSVEGHKGIFKESQLQKILKPETLPEQPDTETASEENAPTTYDTSETPDSLPFDRGSRYDRDTRTEAQRRADAQVYDAGKALLESAGIKVHEVSGKEAQAMLRHEKTPVAGQPNRANEKLTSGSVLLSISGNSSSNRAASKEAGAKLQNKTQSAKNKITKFKNGDYKVESEDVASAIRGLGKMFSMDTRGGSRYTILRADNGDTVAIRLADHPANGNNFRQDNADKNLSIVIERKRFNTPDSEIEFTEAIISEATFNADPRKAVDAIVKGVESVLTGGEFELDSSIGTVKPMGGKHETPKFSIETYHGTHADFDAFSHDHVGEGEGNQAFGWGTYVSESEGVGRYYAKGISKRNGEQRLSVNGREVDCDGFTNPWRLVRDLFVDCNGRLREMRERAERYAEFAEEDSPMHDVWPQVVEILKNHKRGDIKALKPQAHLYTVEIPDDTGNNYLDWESSTPKGMLDKIKAALAKKGVNSEMLAEMDGGSGKATYKTVARYYGSDKAASELLSSLGITGIRYLTESLSGGNRTGEHNYVIFNDADLKITGHARFLRDGQGIVYGWTSGGEVFLNRDAMNPETPLHEYTHLWDTMVQRENPALWSRGKELLRQTAMWRQVIEDAAYADIRDNEDAVASEVHSRLTGQDGQRLLRSMIEDARKEGPLATAEASTMAQRLRRWITDMYSSLKQTLSRWSGRDLSRLTLEDFNRLTLRDLAKGINPQRETARSRQASEVNETNRMRDDYHTGIRSREDVRSFDEVLAEAEKDFAEDGAMVYPDMDIETMRQAKNKGTVTVYSSKPIEAGTFVTPSRMNASDYAGEGRIYEKEIPVDSVAWISIDEGQYTPASLESEKQAWNDRPFFSRRQRGSELTPSLFGPEQPRRRTERTPSLFQFKTESPNPDSLDKPASRKETSGPAFANVPGARSGKPDTPELTPEQQQSADRANAAIDRYVDAFAEHLERTENLAEDIPDDISAPFYDARDRALDAIADHYRALGNTEADARRMARDQLTTVTAEASVRLNRKPATLPAEEGVPYRPAEKTETEAEAKAYRTGGGEVIEYSSDGLPRKEEGEFALVERKFVADGYFGFTGSETVETADDVAYLFRQLENHATEHAFVLLVKDGRPTVVHIGQGSFDATLVNFGAIRAANDALGGADGIYFVHNHPSGNLAASGPDLNIMRTLEKMFPDQARPGVIIDTTSGRYLQFTGRDISSLETRPTEARGAEKPYTVNNFDRQVFSPEYDFGTLRQIRDESDVAAYVSTLRLGARDKISFLVLDRANKITGNFHTDFDRYSDHEEMADMMIRQALRFGGTSVIMYGNEKALRPERAVRDAFSAQMKDIFKRKSGDSVRFLDNVSVKNGLDSSAGQSASEAAPTYGTDKNEAGRSEAALKHLEPSSTGNDAAKVVEIIDTAKNRLKKVSEQYRESPTPKGFLSDLGNALGLKYNSNGSGYRHFELSDGRSMTVRVSNHNSKAKNAGDYPVVSIVIKSKRSRNSFEPQEGKVIREYVYMKEDIKKAPAGTLSIISDSIAELLDTGEYTDHTGLAKENRSPAASTDIRFREQESAHSSRRDSGTAPTPREARAAVPVLDLAVRDTRARLDAAGDPQERRELREQLDQLLEEQDAYATGRAPQTPEQRANVRRAAETTAAALGEKVIIHTAAAGITHPDAAVRARMRRAKGWYDAATGEVHINAFNHATEADVARTMLHESIGHKALRDFYGERFDSFLDEIYSSAEEPIRRQIASRMGNNGWNVREATEEYMATLAETVDRHGAENLDTAARRTWQRTKTAVKRTLNRILEKAGLTTRVNLTDRDLSYLLWRQYRSRRKAGALEAAENQTRLEALRRDPESFAAEVGFREEQKNPTWKETSYALTDSLTGSRMPHQEDAALDSQSKSDTAKVQRISGNLQTFAEKIPEKGLGKNELVYSFAKSLGIQRAESSKSNYLELNINGVGQTTIRISSHSAEMDNFRKTKNNVGIVIKTSRHRFSPKADTDYVEFMYYGDKTEHNAERQRQIAEGLRHYIETGSFEQMPEPDRLNTSGAYRRAVDALNNRYRFRDGDQEAAADPAAAEETRSRRIFDLMVDMCNRNKDNVEYRDAARKTLTGRLATVARGMRLQRDFDRAQLAAVTDTCNKMIGLEILDTDSRADMARTIKAIGGSAGKEDLEDTAYRLLGIASHSQVRMARRRLDDLSRIRGTKTGDDRIQRQAGLDPEGQATAKAFRDFRKLPEQNIQTAMARVSERIAGDDVPESASMLAAAEMLGLRQALLHSQEDALHRDNLAGIEDALRDLKNQWDPSLSGEERRRYRQARKSLGQQRIVEELRHADALGAIADSMGDTLQASKERVRIFREAEKERVNNIHHDANCDMQGRPAHADKPARSKLVNNTLTSFFLAPTMTFDQMLRMFGKHSANGEGYLYYRFMSGPQGWQACEDRRFKSKQAKERILDRKAAEILGKDKAHWADLYKLTRAEGCTLTYNSAGVEVERKVSQGNLMYIYMANKMTDGAVKLRHMNITEEDMDLVEEVLDPRLRQLADWIQDEFLPSTRDGYNEVHIRMFGAPMDYVENYFPLKITEGEIQKNVEIGEMMNDGEGDTPKILTGAIRKRVFNTRALNVLDSDPVAITLEHLEEMEDWAAFSEFRRDLGTLLSYRRFKNQVKNTTSVYGAGEKLWKRFGETAQLVGGADQGMRSGMVGEVDKAVVNLCKLGTASRITYRVFTALKQFTSLPAFGSDTNLWNAIHSTATPRASWQWCMENLPSFEKRWVTRQAGNEAVPKVALAANVLAPQHPQHLVERSQRRQQEPRRIAVQRLLRPRRFVMLVRRAPLHVAVRVMVNLVHTSLLRRAPRFRALRTVAKLHPQALHYLGVLLRTFYLVLTYRILGSRYILAVSLLRHVSFVLLLLGLLDAVAESLLLGLAPLDFLDIPLRRQQTVKLYAGRFGHRRVVAPHPVQGVVYLRLYLRQLHLDSLLQHLHYLLPARVKLPLDLHARRVNLAPFHFQKRTERFGTQAQLIVHHYIENLLNLLRRVLASDHTVDGTQYTLHLHLAQVVQKPLVHEHARKVRNAPYRSSVILPLPRHRLPKLIQVAANGLHRIVASRKIVAARLRSLHLYLRHILVKSHVPIAETRRFFFLRFGIFKKSR